MLALVWKRVDFSETSRLVTLITREEGRLTALAKGAHRPGSAFLGRLDLLNVVDASFARRRRSDSLRVLAGAALVHEPRGLRQPMRFLCASYLVEAVDAAFLEGRADAELFDLLNGAVVVLERCPEAILGTTLAALELKLLDALGRLASLEGCSACGAPGALHLEPDGGLTCARHRTPGARPLRTADLMWLRRARTTLARAWSALPRPSASTVAILGAWVAAAIERTPKLRRAAYDATRGFACRLASAGG